MVMDAQPPTLSVFTQQSLFTEVPPPPFWRRRRRRRRQSRASSRGRASSPKYSVAPPFPHTLYPVSYIKAQWRRMKEVGGVMAAAWGRHGDEGPVEPLHPPFSGPFFLFTFVFVHPYLRGPSLL